MHMTRLALAAALALSLWSPTVVTTQPSCPKDAFVSGFMLNHRGTRWMRVKMCCNARELYVDSAQRADVDDATRVAQDFCKHGDMYVP